MEPIVNACKRFLMPLALIALIFMATVTAASANVPGVDPAALR